MFNALDPSARGNLQWVMNPTTYSYIYRMTPPTSTSEPPIIFPFGGPMFDAKVNYWSTMSTAQTVCVTGERVVIGGDFKAGVLIGDRLGMTVEIIPHILSAAGLPYGQRGLVCWWRTGCVVRDVNKLRYLEIA